MINYYEKSKKEFIKYIKKNPYTTQTEWDKYAHKNYLFSAITLCSHEITDNTLEMLQKHSKSEFEYLKEMFIIIPDKRFKILKNKINKIKEIKKREKKTDVTR
jgi:hypothetical protein|nr:MAG TPA: hypothetical protein [Caudoviricetes sp.]DAW54876.1 MAG TPA: hypothetical protein [Caudoviricetes sp.]